MTDGSVISKENLKIIWQQWLLGAWFVIRAETECPTKRPQDWNQDCQRWHSCGSQNRRKVTVVLALVEPAGNLGRVVHGERSHWRHSRTTASGRTGTSEVCAGSCTRGRSQSLARREQVISGTFCRAHGYFPICRAGYIGGNKTTPGIHHRAVPQDPVPWSVFLLLFTFQSSDACLINNI